MGKKNHPKPRHEIRIDNTRPCARRCIFAAIRVARIRAPHFDDAGNLQDVSSRRNGSRVPARGAARASRLPLRVAAPMLTAAPCASTCTARVASTAKTFARNAKVGDATADSTCDRTPACVPAGTHRLRATVRMRKAAGIDVTDDRRRLRRERLNFRMRGTGCVALFRGLSAPARGEFPMRRSGRARFEVGHGRKCDTASLFQS